MKFRTELWRIIKFILITAAVNVVFTIAYTAITNALVASRSRSIGELLSLLSYGYTILTAITAALLHRYFTFRSREKWYFAALIMVIAALGWKIATSMLMTILLSAFRADIHLTTALSSAQGFLWVAVAYLLQRGLLYSHSFDNNGWYRRLHPDTNEEGA